MMKIPESYRRVGLLSKLLFMDLLRRRVTLLLLFIIPALFDLVILITTAEIKDPVVFGILSNTTIHMVSRRGLSFIYLGIAAVCFLTSFLAFYLVFQRLETDRRLALCGFKPLEIIFAKVMVMLFLIITITIYEGFIIRPFIEPHSFTWVLIGLFLGGLIYSCFGLLVGSISFHELEGIFLIVLVANIDVGWLQNPIYYNDSTNKTVIEHLPGFFPTQLAAVATFTSKIPMETVLGSLIYAGLFLFFAVIAFWWQLRLKNTSFLQKKG